VSQEEQRPISQAEFKALLEDGAASDLFAWLRGRGRRIEDIHWPDRGRRGRKGKGDDGKTVDLTFLEDGRPVGVDIVELHESADHARQNAEMTRIVGEIERDLRPQLRELNPGHGIAISWVLSWLPPNDVLQRGVETVKRTILEAAPALRDGDRVDLEPRPDFVREMHAICWSSATPRFGFVGRHAEQTGRVGEAAASMVESLLSSSKPAQLQAFPDARVLAIDRVVMPFADEMEAALGAQTARIPSNWTAIYYVVPWRPAGSITVVWSRPPRAPS